MADRYSIGLVCLDRGAYGEDARSRFVGAAARAGPTPPAPNGPVDVTQQMQ
jgi:hypothetical protein